MEYTNPDDIVFISHPRDSNWHCARMVNMPVHPAEISGPMPQCYALPDRRRIERVPRPPLFSPPQDSIPPVTFSVNGWPGVRVKDILKGNVVIDAANDAVLAPHGWRTTVLNLKWPGYDSPNTGDPMVSRINVRPDGQDITRQALAREICALFFNFHQVALRHKISPDCEKWELTAGPEGIRPADIVLLSVHYYRTTWVPEFYVIE